MVRYAIYKSLGSPQLQKLADQMLKNPRLEKLAESNPDAFRAMVIDISKRATGGKVALPNAAQNDELDRDSSQPAQYKEERVDESEAQQKFLRGN